MKLHFLPVLAALGLLTIAPVAHAQTTVRFGLRMGGNLATHGGDDPAYALANGGISGSGTVTNSSMTNYKRSAIVGWQLGTVLDINFGKVAFQPALLLTQKGVSQTLDATNTTRYNSGGFGGSFTSTITEKYAITSRPNYLELPLNVVYTTGGTQGFQVFAGPYVAYGVGGQAELEREYMSSATGSGQSGSSYSYGRTFISFRDTYPGAQLTGNTNGSGGSGSAGNTSPTDYLANSGALVARRFDAGINAGIGYRFASWQVQAGYGWGLINPQPDHAPRQRDDLTPYYNRVGQLTLTYLFASKPTPSATTPGM